jgi:hypothetical protein
MTLTRKREDIIKMVLKEIGCEGEEFIGLA